jgi:hypothetical protein
VKTVGNSKAFFGPYYLDVGCTETSVVFTDSPSFVTNVPLLVGDPVVGVYTLEPPTSSRVWCVVRHNEIVNPDGTPWSGSA